MQTLFQKWSKTESPIQQFPVNLDSNRSIYKTPFNVNLIVTYVIPRNYFKSTYTYTVLDLNIKVNEETKQLAKKYNCKFDIGGWYTDDGYGVFVFNDSNEIESIEHAFLFLLNEHKSL